MKTKYTYAQIMKELSDMPQECRAEFLNTIATELMNHPELDDAGKQALAYEVACEALDDYYESGKLGILDFALAATAINAWFGW